jgi:hypothetical protein
VSEENPPQIGPKLAAWLAGYRSRPEPQMVVVATFDLVDPVPDTPENAMAAGQVAIDIIRYDRMAGAAR